MLQEESLIINPKPKINFKVLISFFLLSIIVISAALSPILGLDPIKQDLYSRLKPPIWSSGGSYKYILGTDHLGRDMLARLVYGARISLLIGFISVVVAGGIGIPLGLIAGYYRGRVDVIIMRLLDIQFSFPFVLLVILIVAVIGASLTNIIICLGVVAWTFYARLVRAEVLRIREEDYIEAALALGASNIFIIIRHILPNIMASIIVLATLTIPRMIIIESSLSWLGLSIPPPTPTWGSMVADSRDYLTVSWWMATFPGIAIMVVVLSVNLLGDWLRDRLDPKLK